MDGVGVKFVEQVKYLGVLLHVLLNDYNNIQRKVKTDYCEPNKLKRTFAQCSTEVKNTLFRVYFMTMHAFQLWRKYTQSGI